MVPLETARARVFERVGRLPIVQVPVIDSAGLVLAADVAALESVPPFDNTAVDGFAVRAADTASVGNALLVIGTLAAGGRGEQVVGVGEALRIMTGAPMPDGADAVVMVEDSGVEGNPDGSNETVRFSRSVSVGDAVRRAGSDVVAGTLVFPTGTIIGAPHVGVLASIGYQSVAVVRRARIAVLSTGDELVDDDRPLERGEIRESNRRMLLALVRAAGCDAVDYGVVRDDEAALEATLRRAADECDAIVTSGGVSMGDFDVVKAVLGRIATMDWMQIAIKPAKPFAFGLVGATPVFGLPGNPVSAMVSFEVIARPALRRMMGHTVEADRPRVLARAGEALRRRPDGKLHLARVHGRFAADGRFEVRSSGEQGSHQLAATAAANAIAFLPDGDGVDAGDNVEVFLL